METIGLWLGRLSLVLLVLGAVLWLWPRDRQIVPPHFDASTLPADLDAWLAEREARLNDVTPGAEKRIVWAGERGVKTPVAVVYVHGFSASPQETRPVPDKVAAALGANLYFARLAGHGRPGPALATASADDWVADFAESMAIGARLGERVVILASSTGATITVAALGTPELRAAIPEAGRISGIAMLSPNFALASRLETAGLDLPFAHLVVPLAIGHQQNYSARNADHRKYWTLDFPTPALFPMAKIMRAARAVDTATLKMPLLLLQSPDDRVVDPKVARKVLGAWGGPVTRTDWPWAPGMDQEAHVIAGDIRSPGMTEAVAARISDWAGGL